VRSVAFHLRVACITWEDTATVGINIHAIITWRYYARIRRVTLIAIHRRVCGSNSNSFRLTGCLDVTFLEASKSG